jgi:hypothetical protein
MVLAVKPAILIFVYGLISITINKLKKYVEWNFLKVMAMHGMISRQLYNAMLHATA